MLLLTVSWTVISAEAQLGVFVSVTVTFGKLLMDRSKLVAPSPIIITEQQNAHFASILPHSLVYSAEYGECCNMLVKKLR
mmetsp:Transcript_64411/g.102522  ORF Transcript_64411/g.102522 Transcript_64411/m.102522 type:complete len:80 (+) Transcript_64411:63-302(+)